MNIDIKKLSPELIEDYLHFFDTVPHATNNEEHKCYCIWWCNKSLDGKDYSTVENRRNIATEYISNNNIQGYLAYYNNKVIGWCNTNTKSNCYECFCWRNFMNAIQKDDNNVKAVFCFAISPEFREKGIAGMLLNRVCEDAKKDGFDVVEGYPNKIFIDTEQDYMGPVKLYEKLGFTVYYEADKKLVMRKKLR